LFAGFDPLGHHLQSELSTERDDGGRQGAVPAASFCVGDESAIDFEFIKG
jgi:hypothetical protein